MSVDLAQGALSLGSYYRIGWEILWRYQRYILLLFAGITLPITVLQQESVLAKLMAVSPPLHAIVMIFNPTVFAVLNIAALSYVMLLASHELQRKVVVPRKLLSLVRDNLLLVVGGLIVFSLIVSAGILLLVLPGLFLAVMLCFFMQEILIAQESLFGSFSKSWDLVRQNFGRTLIANLTFILPPAIVSAYTYFNPFGPTGTFMKDLVVNAYILLVTLVSTVLFLNLRAMQRAAEHAAAGEDSGDPQLNRSGGEETWTQT